MPGVINYNEGNIDLSSSKYQKYDYLIAAEVSYFNQNKIGELPRSILMDFI